MLNIKKFVYRACPRCGGDLALEPESREIEYACMQCGRTFDLKTVLRMLQEKSHASQAGPLARSAS